jgi:hypothetical protein
MEERLMSLMADPHEFVRRDAVNAALQINIPTMLPILLDVLEGKGLPIQDLPPVPEYEECVVLDQPHTDYPGCSETEMAALNFGIRNFAAGKPRLRDLALTGTPVYTVALALQGEVERLEVAHFDTAVNEGIASCSGSCGALVSRRVWVG